MSPRDSAEDWPFGMVNWDRRAFVALDLKDEMTMPTCLHDAIASEMERLRGMAEYLESLKAAKFSISRVDGTVRAPMTVRKADLLEYIDLYSRIHAASGRTRSPYFHVFVQDCIIRNVFQ